MRLYWIVIGNRAGNARFERKQWEPVFGGGGGRQAMNKIYGDMLECDASRVYDATTVRRVTWKADDE